jgi:hypothetical protein
VPLDWLFADGRVSAVCHDGGERLSHTRLGTSSYQAPPRLRWGSITACPLLWSRSWATISESVLRRTAHTYLESWGIYGRRYLRRRFWGEVIRHSRAGPAPIDAKALTAAKLAEAIGYAQSRDAKAAALRLGEAIRAENGLRNGVESFHRHLPLLNMR